MNGGTGRSVNNVLVNNYWDNVGEDVINSDASSPVDPSPVTHPVAIAFNSAQYPPPIPTVTSQTNEPTKDLLQQHQSLLLAASALTITALAGLHTATLLPQTTQTLPPTINLKQKPRHLK